MSFNDDDSSDIGLSGQTKLESFLFSKEHWLFYVFVSGGAHVGLLRGCENTHFNIFGWSLVIFFRLDCILNKTRQYSAFCAFFSRLRAVLQSTFLHFPGRWRWWPGAFPWTQNSMYSWIFEPFLSTVNISAFMILQQLICFVFFSAGLSGRGRQGGEQCGGGDSHEPPGKDHLSAHRQPSHQLSAHGTVATQIFSTAYDLNCAHHVCVSISLHQPFISAGESGGVWAESPSDHQAEGWDRTGYSQRLTPHRLLLIYLYFTEIYKKLSFFLLWGLI